MKKVLLLTGPGGAGKTTVARLLAEQGGYAWLDGDAVDSEFFPEGGHWLPQNAETLRLAHDKILGEARKLFDEGNSVIVDYIVFGHYKEFIERLRREFGKVLAIKVLFPSKEETVRRDIDRECWTTGEKRITEVMAEFEELKGYIGSENYLDTTGQTPEETAAWLLKE